MQHNAKVTRLPPRDLVTVERIGVHDFADWKSLKSYVSEYAQRTNQIFIAHSVVDVATHNASVPEDRKKVPDYVGVYSQVFGCIYGDGQLQILDPECWKSTQCPAQIEAHVTFDFNGFCRFVITEQYAYHNHAISKELVVRYRQMNACVKIELLRHQQQQGRRNDVANKRQQCPSDERPITAAADVDLVDLTSDQEDAVSDSESCVGRGNAPSDDVISAPETSAGNSDTPDKNGNEVVVARVDTRDVDIEEHDGEATSELSVSGSSGVYSIPVSPMDQTEFEDWDELGNYLDAYCKSTYQTFVVRSGTHVRCRNSEIKRNKVRDDKKLIPEHFQRYYRQWRCLHHKRTIDCPAEISARVQQEQPSGLWKVVILSQSTHHNHEISRQLFYSCAMNRRIKDPALHAVILKLFFQRVNCKEIAKSISKHLEFEPMRNEIYNLVSKLRRVGWTVDNCAQKCREVASSNKSSGPCEGGANGANKRSQSAIRDGAMERTEVGRRKKQRSKRIVQAKKRSTPSAADTSLVSTEAAQLQPDVDFIGAHKPVRDDADSALYEDMKEFARTGKRANESDALEEEWLI